MRTFQSTAGFTLVELIVVVVLLGIMATGASYFVIKPLETYIDIERRQELTDSAEMTFRRLSRDINRALPNSIRIHCQDSGGTQVACNAANVVKSRVEMINIVDGARYRDQAGTGQTNANHILDFTSADSQFNILGTFQAINTSTIPNNYRLVIYNTSDTIYGEAQADNSPNVITPSTTTFTVVTATSSDTSTSDEHQITLSTAHQFKYRSPSQRLFVIDGTVIYECNASTGTLIRYKGTDYQANASSVNLASYSSALMTQNISACSMRYDAGQSQRSGLFTLEVQLSKHSESINLLHQIHVINAP